MNKAREYIEDSDYVLVVAGSGLSVFKGRNTYGSSEDFKKLYPALPSYGYHSSYDCMGLFHDDNVPMEVKWGYQGLHIRNQRYTNFIHPAYPILLELVKTKKDYFVMTSNVDGYFERAGFNPNHIYTPQGDWKFYQCFSKCTDEVWSSKKMITDLIEQIDEENTRVIDTSVIPSCPNCGGMVYGNVRGGNWFIHKPYEEQQKRMISFLDGIKVNGGSLVVFEIGCGWNTPVVTRYPAEAISRDLQAKFIRLNPSEGQAAVPADLVSTPGAIGLPLGWEAIEELLQPQSSSIQQQYPMETQRSPHCNWRSLLSNLL